MKYDCLVEILLNSGVIVDLKNYMGYILLYIVYNVGYCKIVSFFLDKGVDINVIDNMGFILLYVVC